MSDPHRPYGDNGDPGSGPASPAGGPTYPGSSPAYPGASPAYPGSSTSAGPAPVGGTSHAHPSPAPAPGTGTANGTGSANGSGPANGTGSANPAGTGTMSAAQAGQMLQRVGIGNPLPTFALGALAYVAALLAAVLVIISFVLAGLTADTSSLPGGGTDPLGGPSGGGSSGGGGFRGFLGLLGLPFQLVSLATFGSYVMDLDLSILGSMTLVWRGLPLLITLAMVVVGFVGARFAQRRLGSGRFGRNGPLGALLWSLISGFAVALFAVIITRLTAYQASEGDVSITMHSAGFDMFLGTWVLIALPLFLGHIAGGEKPRWWPLVADLAAAPRLALTHALLFAIPVGILTFVFRAIGMIADGEGRSVLTLFLLLPAWGLTALAMLPGLGMLVVPIVMTARGDVSEFGVQVPGDVVWFFDLPWYAWIAMILLGLLVLLIVPVLWNRDRAIVKNNILGQVASWIALPCAYFTCSLILLALVWTSIWLDMGLLGDMGVSFGLGMWMPIAAFFLGAVVELISRFGAPFVDRFVPGLLVDWFRRSARKRRAADGTAAHGATADGAAPTAQDRAGAQDPVQGYPGQPAQG